MMDWRIRALPALALVGIVGTAIALLIDPHDTLAAYLAAAVAASARSRSARCGADDHLSGARRVDRTSCMTR